MTAQAAALVLVFSASFAARASAGGSRVSPRPAAVADEGKPDEPQWAPLRTDSPHVGRILTVLAAAVLDTPVLNTDGRESASQGRIAQDLAALGPDVVPVLLAILSGAVEPAEEGAPLPAALCGAPGVEPAIRAALAMLPPGAVASELARACAGAPLQQRLVALRILAEVGDASATEAFGAILAGVAEADLSGTFASVAAEDSLALLLARDRSAVALLARTCASFGPAVAPIVARSVSKTGLPSGMDVLVALLGPGDVQQVEVVAAIGELAESSGARVGERVLERLRQGLSGTDRRQACAAALALARLRDVASAPVLVGLLSGPDPEVSSACAAALRHLAASDQGGSDRERWSAWYESQRGWFDRRGRDLVLQVGEGDRARALEAARELCVRPLFKDQAAGAVAELLRRSDPELARAGCRTLQELGSKTALPALVDALGHPDAGVRAAAGAALSRLTGRALPAEQIAWKVAGF